MAVAASVFFASLFGLWLLFAMKALEIKRGARFLPSIMARADLFALAVKRFLMDARVILSRIPPLVMYLSRFALHELALGAAKSARVMEMHMHKVADLVSHKRSFERRGERPTEPRSEFLKKVAERTAEDEKGEI